MKLVGFKSFADRTRLHFEPGVSVVVGPNGTGKSNIVDAVAWVLGSQFTRALRTDRMEDVIFAGTASRASHNRAEVTVVLDNRDRVLPLDLDEVSLTRRLFRGGGSDYEINGVQCRLLDVQDLLSDSGVGRSQHLIVGQGRLEPLLTAKGDERRRIIEEAAGILKHQVRKARALQRLERTDADLVRLHDIVAEIKRRKRPLRRQAEAAERHRSMRSELRALHLWLGGEALRNSRRRSDALSAERADLEETLKAGSSGLARLEDILAGLERQRSRRAESLARDVDAAASLSTVAARLRGVAQVARERCRGLVGRMEQAARQRNSLDLEIEGLQEQLREATSSEHTAKERVASGEETLRAAEERMQALPVRDEADPVMMRDDLRSLEMAAARDARETAKLTERLEAARATVNAEKSRAPAVAEELDRTTEGIETARRVYREASQALEGHEAGWERTDRLLREARTGRAAADAKAEALEAAAAPSSEPLMERLADLGGVVGTLSSLLDPPDDLVAAGGRFGGWMVQGPGLRRPGPSPAGGGHAQVGGPDGNSADGGLAPGHPGAYRSSRRRTMGSRGVDRPDGTRRGAGAGPQPSGRRGPGRGLEHRMGHCRARPARAGGYSGRGPDHIARGANLRSRPGRGSRVGGSP